MSTFAHPESLVSTQWVVEYLNDLNVRIVEVIWGSQEDYGWEAYAAGHIPGAVDWDYEADFQDAQGDVIDRGVFDRADIRYGIWDAVNDPLAGFLPDNTRTR